MTKLNAETRPSVSQTAVEGTGTPPSLRLPMPFRLGARKASRVG